MYFIIHFKWTIRNYSSTFVIKYDDPMLGVLCWPIHGVWSDANEKMNYE